MLKCPNSDLSHTDSQVLEFPIIAIRQHLWFDEPSTPILIFLQYFYIHHYTIVVASYGIYIVLMFNRNQIPTSECPPPLPPKRKRFFFINEDHSKKKKKWCIRSWNALHLAELSSIAPLRRARAQSIEWGTGGGCRIYTMGIQQIQVCS